ncbi:MAG: SAM-dependent methyltransferase [Ancylobacter novellus]|uniref:SAM-dependent methyltransferase n=1 Tax=Ancylobacter novellus TaxID=921 RepID=A0A2W5KPH5_ANCNO|nr:MAG: SAM-dependent methyltransferase [Ancylobacter novellus]
MTPLGREIASAIAAAGPMRLDRYMALCLGHPLHGYYATRDPFGRDGDFVTAPEISQMFGELIGLWAAEVWLMSGSPARFSLVELGPGRGTLMADMTRAARAAPGFIEAAEIVLVETSPTLREVQAKALAGRRVRWVATIEEALGNEGTPPPSPLRGGVGDDSEKDAEGDAAPRRSAALHSEPPPPLPSPQGGGVGSVALSALPAIVIANEFFDALPIRQFVRTDRGWRERLVGLIDGRLAFGLAAEAPSDLALPDGPEGEIREICAPGLDVVAHAAGHVTAHGGAMLAIDYGYGAGLGDTFQAMKSHAFVDPLDAPGEADLTAHVDFGALARAGEAQGAAVMRLLDQADLLERLGLSARAEALSRAAPDRRDEIFAAARRLTDRAPRGMGALFKALAICDPRIGTPPAFEPARRHGPGGS